MTAFILKNSFHSKLNFENKQLSNINEVTILLFVKNISTELLLSTALDNENLVK